MKLYKKSYKVIGLIIFAIGLIILPFLGFIIGNTNSIKENIYLVYFLFLVNTSSSYFFIHKSAIITAHQQESIISNITTIVNIIRCIIEIVFMCITKNYIIYLLIEFIINFIQNVIISKTALKMYPYLKEKNIKPLKKTEKNQIIKNVKSLISYKIGGIMFGGTDNIIMSIMINIVTVGYCSNYTMIIGSLKSILLSAQDSVTASVANLNTTRNRVKKEKIFYNLTFIHFLTFSILCTALIILLNDFITIWLGPKYLLGFLTIFAMCFSCYIQGMRGPAYIYRIMTGLFTKGKFTPYISTIVNISTSIILCRVIGVAGIFIGTCLAQLSSYFWIDPYLIHKHIFHTSSIKYFKDYIYYLFIFSLQILTSYYVCSLFKEINIFIFILKAFIVVLLCILIILIFTHNKREYQDIKKRLLFRFANK